MLSLKSHILWVTLYITCTIEKFEPRVEPFLTKSNLNSKLLKTKVLIISSNERNWLFFSNFLIPNLCNLMVLSVYIFGLSCALYLFIYLVWLVFCICLYIWLELCFVSVYIFDLTCVLYLFIYLTWLVFCICLYIWLEFCVCLYIWLDLCFVSVYIFG